MTKPNRSEIEFYRLTKVAAEFIRNELKPKPKLSAGEIDGGCFCVGPDGYCPCIRRNHDLHAFVRNVLGNEKPPFDWSSREPPPP